MSDERKEDYLFQVDNRRSVGGSAIGFIFLSRRRQFAQFSPFPFTRSERFYEEWALLLVHSHKLRVTRTKGAANWINCLWATRRTDPILIISANCRKTTECRHNKQRNFTLYAIWGILSKLSFSEIVW